MKSYITLVALSLVFVACKKQEGNELIIKGELADTSSGYVVLKMVNDSAVTNIDSVKMSNSKTFEIKTKATEKSFYYLDVCKKQMIFLVGGPGENLSVKADGKKGSTDFTVSGSVDNDNMKLAVNLLNSYQVQAENLQKEYFTLIQQGKQTEAQALLEKADNTYMQTVEDAKNLIRKFGPTLPAMSLAANFISPKVDFNFLDSLSQEMNKNLPNSKYTKNFVKFVDANRGLKIGDMAPDFSVSTPNDKWVKLSDFKGKIVLLDFWASWCKPCREENPNVVKLYQKYKDKGFDILSFSLDENKADWQQAISEDNLTWTQVSELKGWESPQAQVYKVTSIPATYLIGKDGKIIAINLRGEELEQELEKQFAN